MRRSYPSLRLFDPRSFYNAWIYALLNILIGIYFTYSYQPTRNNIIYGPLSFQTWGLIWIVSGLVLVWFLMRNKWQAIKHAMIGYLFFKTFWTIALVFYGFNHDFISILGSLAIWAALFALQVITCVYFIDPNDLRRK